MDKKAQDFSERRERKEVSAKDFKTLEDLKAHIAKERRWEDRVRLTSEFYKKRRLRTILYILVTISFSALISVIVTFLVIS